MATPAPPPLVELTGPIFIGAILNWALLGTLTLQVYIYSLESKKDRKIIKATVYSLFVIDLLQTGLATDYAWKTLVFFDPNVLLDVPRSSLSLSFVNPVISAIVQIFFAWRIWYLNQSKWARVFPILIVLVALMQAISAIVASIRFTLTSDIAQLAKLRDGFTVWLVGTFVADVLIAACMVYVLRKAQQRAFSLRSETILTRLLMNAVNTGAVTAVGAGIELIMFLVFTNNNYHQAPAFVLGKLYSNVLLANLNARAQNKNLGMDANLNSTGAGQSSGSSNAYKLSRMAPTVGFQSGRSRADNDLESGIIHVRTEVVDDIAGDRDASPPTSDSHS
ncbi:hypothetical protein K435DRAFT_850589 [Dendrothele bispora CBS 962.96]|uniref:DUF6534 domain-containing protein n=1 Tax=Dendrothele bispora (strain CBS 962.96) TaxID=1314807 RepID=A0A4S8MP23_DENBC|nr:hypothetical protein K435DRAFT_850589 [Dendrothele bispora CBS 962.96]